MLMSHPHPQTRPPPAESLWLLSALVALAVLLVFANCLPNAFVWDDEQFVVKNVFLTSPKFLPKLLTENVVAGAGVHSNLYRPLQSLTHFLDVQLWGFRPWGHHLSSIVFHVASSVAVFRLLASLSFAWPAAMATALFALHPLQSEAVAYVCGRGDSLAILFICLGLLSFRNHGWLSLCFAALAMASKEHAAIFPALLFLYDRAGQHPSPFRRHLPFWLLSAAYATARLTVLNFGDTLNFYHQPNLLTEHWPFRLYTYLTTLPKGLLLWFWPADLHHERSWSVATSLTSPRVWLSLLVVAVLLSTAVRLRKRALPAAIGIGFFFVATIPTSNLFVLINALFYDHWFLLPGVGLVIAVSHALSRIWVGPTGRRRAAVAAGCLAIIVLSGLTWHHNRIWRSPLTLYTHLLSWEPHSAKIHHNLAMAYADAGQTAQAIPLYQQAIALSDEYPHTHYNLANAYLTLGQEDRAVEELKRALAIDPTFYHALLRLGSIDLRHHQLTEAATAFEQALRSYPYAAEAYLGLAQIRLAQGDSRAALAILQSGLDALPHHPALQDALGHLQTLPGSDGRRSP